MNSGPIQKKQRAEKTMKLSFGHMASEESHEALVVQTPGLKVLTCRSLAVAEAIDMERRCPRQESEKLC